MLIGDKTGYLLKVSGLNIEIYLFMFEILGPFSSGGNPRTYEEFRHDFRKGTLQVLF